MAVGICGTDLKISTGGFKDTRLPMILGHEVAGELVEDAGDMKKGQRVALQVFHPCGKCRWCLIGEETLCPDPPRIGFNRDRPLLLGNPRAQWIRLMEARRPLYEQIATHTVTTDGKLADEVAADVVARVSA